MGSKLGRSTDSFGAGSAFWLGFTRSWRLWGRQAGHFAAMEAPALLVGDVRTFFGWFDDGHACGSGIGGQIRQSRCHGLGQLASCAHGLVPRASVLRCRGIWGPADTVRFVENECDGLILDSARGFRAGNSLDFLPDVPGLRLLSVVGHNPVSLGPRLTGHTGPVESMMFSPDGHTLASASADQTVRLWQMGADQAIQQICAHTNALTRQQWQQNLPQIPFSPPCG